VEVGSAGRGGVLEECESGNGWTVLIRILTDEGTYIFHGIIDFELQEHLHNPDVSDVAKIKQPQRSAFPILQR